MNVCKTFRTVSAHIIWCILFQKAGQIHFQTKLLKVPREKLKAFKGIKLIFLGYSIMNLK